MHVQNTNSDCNQPFSYEQQLGYNAVKWEHAHSSHYSKWKYDVPQGYSPSLGQTPFDYGVPRVESWANTCPKVTRTCPCPKTAPSNPEVTKTPNEQMLHFQRNFDLKCNDLNKLSHDLSNMMEQLACLTKNKNTALKIVNELQQNYKNLLKKSSQQEKEIDDLKSENKKLLLQLKKGNDDGAELTPLKRGLQTCENKLEMLEKSMNEMVKKYQNVTENGVVNQNEKQELLKVNVQLTNRLKQALEDLEKYRNGVTGICKLYNDSNDTNEDADPNHQKVVTQQMSLASRLQQFEENDMKRLQEIISQNDLQLENEVKKISTYIEEQPSTNVSITKSSTEVVEVNGERSRKEFSKNKSSHLQRITTSKDTNEKKKEPSVGSKASTVAASDNSRSIELKKSLSQLICIINEEITKTIDSGKRMEEIEDCNSNCVLPAKQNDNDCCKSLDEENEENCGPPCVLPTEQFDIKSPTSQDEEAQMDQESMTAELKNLETKYCTTIDEDYELECLCEPCES